MRRVAGAITAATVATSALIVPAGAADALDYQSEVSDVSTSWTDDAIAVQFRYDTWDYARVDASTMGTVVGSKVLPD